MLQMLLLQGKLQVHSENCVVFLLSAWMEGKQLSRIQKKGLASKVRVVNLSLSYLTTVVPKLDLFEGCNGMGSLPQLLLSKAAGKTGQVGLPADIPRAWLSKPRTTVSNSLPQRLSLILGAEEVKKVADGEDLASVPRYCNGFYFRLQAWKVKRGRGPLRLISLRRGAP